MLTFVIPSTSTFSSTIRNLINEGPAYSPFTILLVLLSLLYNVYFYYLSNASIDLDIVSYFLFLSSNALTTAKNYFLVAGAVQPLPLGGWLATSPSHRRECRVLVRRRRRQHGHRRFCRRDVVAIRRRSSCARRLCAYTGTGAARGDVVAVRRRCSCPA